MGWHFTTDVFREPDGMSTSESHADVGSANFTSFDADGFTVGTPGNFGGLNGSGETAVAWNWKGGNAISGTGDFAQGTIASTCSRNVAAGFSIVSYTGTGSAGTVGHGLASVPELTIAKSNSNAEGWLVQHKDFSSGDGFLWLHTTAAASTNDAYYPDFPTASVFEVGTSTGINYLDYTYIAYCFHSVEGYSKIGSYEGNGNADGTFVYCGFRPAFVMTKNIDASGQNWMMFDNKRDTYNVSENRLRANDSAVEGSDNDMDILSNGFKLRTGDQSSNGSESLIFIAFAETPFKYANAR